MPDQTSQALERRKLIKKIMEEDGFVSVADLRTKLAKFYDIKARPQTLEKDLRNLGQIEEAEIEPVLDKVLGKCEEYLGEIQSIADDAETDRDKLNAIKLYFTASKAMTQMLRLMTQREEAEKLSERQKKEEKDDDPVTIMFGDD